MRNSQKLKLQMLQESHVTTAEYEVVIYITLIIQLGVKVLEAVKTEANIPISINTPSTT
jgi:hypothetical protein